MSEAANGGITPTGVEIACLYCKERLPASAKFCGKCGQFVDQTATAPTEGQIEKASEAMSRPMPPAPFSGAAPTRAVLPLESLLSSLPLAASLIGRGEIVAALLASLRAGMTSGIFAPEGVGKTALAAEVVARLAKEKQTFPGGVAWIACEALEGEAGLADLWAKVARALQLEPTLAHPTQQQRRAAPNATLAHQQRSLLVLDNIEPGLDAEATLETLARHQYITILLTARQRVPSSRIAAFDLAPLKSEDARTLYLKCLDQAERLPPLPNEEAALAGLLASLGNLPLALELTAAYARIQLLGLEQVTQEVGSNGFIDPPPYDPRKVLLHCFERTWAVLPTHIQTFFASLSLLEGASFPLAAGLELAEETNDDADVPEAENAAVSDLAIVVNYALVQNLPGGDRLRLHPLLREYAAQKFKMLPMVLQARLGNALAVYWLSYASAHPGYAGVNALEAEASGLMGAVNWAQEQARHRIVLNFAHALSQAWNVRGRHDEESKLYAWASNAAQKLGDLREQRWAIHQLGSLQHLRGQLGEAQANYEQALTRAWQIGDPIAERDEVYALALLDKQKGRLSEARVGFEQALRLARQSGDLTAEWEGVHALALLDSQMGRLEEARANYEQALALARQLGEPAAEAIELGNFGLFLYQQGERDRGRILINESLGMSRRLSNTYNTGKCHQFLAWLDSGEGNHTGAITHYREALRYLKQAGSPEAKNVNTDLRRLEAEAAVERPFKPEVVRVVRAFLNDNNSWEETRALLEHEQALLLTDEADQFLGALIEQAQQGDTPVAQDRADYVTAHQLLLRDARASNIQDAWQRFKQALLIEQ